jgi:hypothetical protein
MVQPGKKAKTSASAAPAGPLVRLHASISASCCVCELTERSHEIPPPLALTITSKTRQQIHLLRLAEYRMRSYSRSSVTSQEINQVSPNVCESRQTSTRWLLRYYMTISRGPGKVSIDFHWTDQDNRKDSPERHELPRLSKRIWKESIF